MTSRAAVIGASGFLGSAIHHGLEREGHRVTPVRRGDPLPRQDFDLVVDCAGDSRRFYCNSHPRHAFDANVAPVLERVVEMEYGLYVLASTVDVYGADKASPAGSAEDQPIRTAALDGYSFSKALAEQVAERHARRALILRLGTLIGPGLRKNPVYDVLHGLALRIGEATTLSLVDTRFVAAAVLALWRQGATGAVNVTGGGSVSTADIVTLARRHRPDLAVEFHPEREDFHYHVAVDKLSAILPVPSGRDMLERFLAEQLESRHGRA